MRSLCAMAPRGAEITTNHKKHILEKDSGPPLAFEVRFWSGFGIKKELKSLKVLQNGAKKEPKWRPIAPKVIKKYHKNDKNQVKKKAINPPWFSGILGCFKVGRVQFAIHFELSWEFDGWLVGGSLLFWLFGFLIVGLVALLKQSKNKSCLIAGTLWISKFLTSKGVNKKWLV